MQLELVGLGTAVPPRRVPQSEAVEIASHVSRLDSTDARRLKALYQRSGVRARHTVIPVGQEDWLGGEAPGGPTTGQRMARYQAEALPLAVRAAQAALDDAGIEPSAIRHLVTVTCTGFAAPGVDIGLIRELGLAPTTERTQLGFMGCHGALNGLRAARGLAAGDPAASILLCAVELCTLHYHRAWDPDRVVGNALFADGAAAVVGRGVPPGPRLQANGEATQRPWRVHASGSCLLPECEDAMTWFIGDHGFEMGLSPRIPDLLRAHVRPWLTAWLDGQGLGLDDVASWAIHPGGPRILNAVQEALELPREAAQVSREVLAEHGNMSSPTILFLLQRMQAAGHATPCVMIGFGPGLVAEALLLV